MRRATELQFAHRQEKWSQPKSTRTGLRGFAADECRLTTWDKRRLDSDWAVACNTHVRSVLDDRLGTLRVSISDADKEAAMVLSRTE
jgi:hypothetical protein